MKKKIKFICIIAICSLIYGCEFNYDLDGDQNVFTPKVVLNGLISPADDIFISMSWSKHHTSQEAPTSSPKGTAKLYENNKLVDESSIDESLFAGTIHIPYTVKAGNTYRIVVDVEDYGVVEAETSIPYAGSVQGEFLEKIKISSSIDLDPKSFYHSQLTDIKIPDLMRAIWLGVSGVYKFKNEYVDLRETEGGRVGGSIYTNNAYVDNFNIGLENNDEQYQGNTLESGGVIFYKGAIRIPSKLIGLSQPLTTAILWSDSLSLSVKVGEYPDVIQFENVTIPISDLAVTIIYPSDDYDKYAKDVYRQSELSFDPAFPIFGEIVYVYSNVKNGLGIFAGYNSKVLDLPIKK